MLKGKTDKGSLFRDPDKTRREEKESDNFSGSYLSVHFITSAMYGRRSRVKSEVFGYGRLSSGNSGRLIDTR